MPAYLAANDDAERSNGRPTSPSSYQRSRYAIKDLLGLCATKIEILTVDRPRSTRGRKEVGMIGQATWTSSVINLVNTSMRKQKIYAVYGLTMA